MLLLEMDLLKGRLKTYQNHNAMKNISQKGV
jgi:hypothetical protein